MVYRVLCCLILSGLLFQFFVSPIYAQSGCSLQINEVMYHPGSGTSGTAVAEWVELYVAQTISVDTTFFITDQDGGVGNFYSKQFTLPAGTAAGSYVIVNNNGNPANDGQTSPTGIYTTISFFIGNGSVELNNDGDEIVLYQGGDVDGVPCDYVEYEGGNTGIPAGFSWNGSCVQPNAGIGFSISLDPDGTASNSSCDWATSGEHSPNNPDLPITGAPNSKGWSNNTTPTAITLASFDVSHRSGMMNVISATGTAVFAFLYIKRKHGK